MQELRGARGKRSAAETKEKESQQKVKTGAGGKKEILREVTRGPYFGGGKKVGTSIAGGKPAPTAIWGGRIPAAKGA